MSKLETTTNVALMVAAVAIVWSVFGPKPKPPQTRDDGSAQLVGKKLSVAGVELRAGQTTLVAVISTKCRYCDKSLPFYRNLSGAQPQTGFQFVALAPQPADEISNHLKQNGVRVDTASTIELSSLGISATPTLLLLDPSGVVRSAWVGFLQENRQKEVFAAVRKACPSCSTPQPPV